MDKFLPFFARNMFKQGISDPENCSNLAGFVKNYDVTKSVLLVHKRSAELKRPLFSNPDFDHA